MQFDFLKDRYDFELERKDKLTAALTLPVGVLTGLGSLLAVMARSFTFRDPVLTSIPARRACPDTWFGCYRVAPPVVSCGRNYGFTWYHRRRPWKSLNAWRTCSAVRPCSASACGPGRISSASFVRDCRRNRCSSWREHVPPLAVARTELGARRVERLLYDVEHGLSL